MGYVIFNKYKEKNASAGSFVASPSQDTIVQLGFRPRKLLVYFVQDAMPASNLNSDNYPDSVNETKGNSLKTRFSKAIAISYVEDETFQGNNFAYLQNSMFTNNSDTRIPAKLFLSKYIGDRKAFYKFDDLVVSNVDIVKNITNDGFIFSSSDETLNPTHKYYFIACK